MDRIMLVNGTSLAGRVLNKAFRIKTDVGTLTIPSKVICQIQFNVSAYGGQDLILTQQSQYKGRILDKIVEIRLVDTGETLQLRTTDILVVFFSLSR